MNLLISLLGNPILYNVVDKSIHVPNTEIPIAGSIACGALAVSIVGANVAQDYRVYQKDGDYVKMAVNPSIVIGSTVVGGVIGNSVGPIGIGYGMLGGSLFGTHIKRQNHFRF